MLRSSSTLRVRRRLPYRLVRRRWPRPAGGRIRDLPSDCDRARSRGADGNPQRAVPISWPSTTPAAWCWAWQWQMSRRKQGSVPVVIRDETGRRSEPGSISLAGNGHTSLSLSTRISSYREHTRHHRIRYAGGRPDQRAGTPLHAAQQCADDDSGAGERRHRRREHRAPRFGRRRLADHFRAGQHRNQRGAGHT